MPKTAPKGKVELDHGAFEANVVPDVFDSRDLDYRSRLQLLPKEKDCRPADRYVLEQKGNSCTGHAVAGMVNAILASQSDETHVSPYMLYALARRYDEFEGEADVGSSLRGALKGWYNHGVLPDEEWPELVMKNEPDLDLDEDKIKLALERPLGAFYRVNATRLDDMQSAVTELFGIVASAAIHDGWHKPKIVTRTVKGKKQTMHVITRTATSKAVGGHAFCIVGYNDVGFLVQNSWGKEWAKAGFATLPYDDWLESGYDAWVARPGVPSVVSRRVRSKILAQAGGGIVEAPGPDVQQLSKHVVNLGNNGRLSQNGKFISTKAQVASIFDNLAAKHADWNEAPKRIVLYAHGGLNSESTGLDIAQRQLNWWLSNRIYPITFAWQTGVTETLENQLSDLIGKRSPAGGFTFNLFEQVDRMIEKVAKRTLKWCWDEMKENAARASDPLPADWPNDADHTIPGGSLAVTALKEYLDKNGPAEIHLVGHSAGSIFLVGIIKQLKAAGIPVESLTYLAAAIRTDEWIKNVLPRLNQGDIKKFTAFGMNPTRELDDVCGANGIAVYRKSLLYLVSRAFEKPTDPDDSEVPLVGMARFAERKVGRTSYKAAVDSLKDGTLVWSPRTSPVDEQSDSSTHGGFDDDNPTMTSVLLRILGTKTLKPGYSYVPNLLPGTSAAAVVEGVTEIADQPPEVVTAEVHMPDEPVEGMPPAAAAAPATAAATSAPGVGEGATAASNRVIDALVRQGWSVETNGNDSKATKRLASAKS